MDVKELVGHVTPYQLRRLFLRFYPGQTTLAEQFVAAAGRLARPLSAAAVQGHFMLYKEAPERAVATVADMGAS